VVGWWRCLALASGAAPSPLPHLTARPPPPRSSTWVWCPPWRAAKMSVRLRRLAALQGLLAGAGGGAAPWPSRRGCDLWRH
jgi:hypothetical protein